MVEVRRIALGHTHASQEVSHDLKPSLASANLDSGGVTRRNGVDDASICEDSQLDNDRLVKALQSRIQVPIYGIGTLRRYLEDAAWVQDIAYEAFMADYRALRVGSMSPGDSAGTSEARDGLPRNIRGVQVVVHTNSEEQRRESMRLLRAVVNTDRDPNNQVEVTLAEAFFTLVLTGWDIEAGALRWASPDIIRWQLHHTFDYLRHTATNQVDIDERTARFAHFTGRDDWHSVRGFLITHNQRFIDAIRAWYRRGTSIVRTMGWNEAERLYVGRRVTYKGQPRSPMPADKDVRPMQINGDIWPSDETSFRPAGDHSHDLAAHPPEDLRTNNIKRQRGFCFTPEGDPPEVAGVMPSHFTIDYLQNGKYRANGFPWEKWFRPELPESNNNQSTNPQFNDHARDHVARLGKWRRQQYSRIEKVKKKATPQDCSKEEKKYLFHLCKRHLNKLMDENPGKTRDEFRPLEFRGGATEKLEKDFNDEFEGKKSQETAEPRHHRKGNALKVKCGRMKKFRVAFGFKKNDQGHHDDNGDDDSSSWSEVEAPSPSSKGPPTSTQPHRVQLTIPSMVQIATTPAAVAVRQSNLDEEATNDTIDTDADGLLE